MSRNTMAIKKNLIVAFLVFAALITGVFANPIVVSDVKVSEVSGDYMVLVTLDNVDNTTGSYTDLSFRVEELGITKTIEGVKVVSEKVVEYNLQDVTDSFDLLQKGKSYRLTVSTDNNSATDVFFFGSEKDTEGLDLILENVVINGEELNDIDLIQVLNGETLDIKLRFSALTNFEDARIMAFVEGYEHSPLVASTQIFSVKEGVTYTKTFSVQLPADMNSQKNYKLRLIGANDLSGLTFKEYTLYVDTQRHRVDVLDLVTTPNSGVEAGQNVIANVRLKNRGQQSQDSIKVSVSVPELNIVESSYVSNLDFGEVVTSDDMLLFVPEDAKAGQYEVLVTLAYDDGYTSTVEKFNLNVLSAKTVSEKNLIVSLADNVDLIAGKATSFEIVVANPNSVSKPISIVASSNAWSDVEVSPSLAMVKGGDSTTFTVSVTPKKAVEGEKQLTLSIKEGTNTISEVTVNTYVEGKTQFNFVNVALAVLLIIAIIILLSLVITIARRRNEDKEDMSSTEEYY